MLYLGLLTSISPCPLATNIAAISYIGRKVDSSRRVLYAGLLYGIGTAVPAGNWHQPVTASPTQSNDCIGRADCACLGLQESLASGWI
jgi:hypothetical protein